MHHNVRKYFTKITSNIFNKIISILKKQNNLYIEKKILNKLNSISSTAKPKTMNKSLQNINSNSIENLFLHKSTQNHSNSYEPFLKSKASKRWWTNKSSKPLEYNSNSIPEEYIPSSNYMIELRRLHESLPRFDGSNTKNPTLSSHDRPQLIKSSFLDSKSRSRSSSIPEKSILSSHYRNGSRKSHREIESGFDGSNTEEPKSRTSIPQMLLVDRSKMLDSRKHYNRSQSRLTHSSGKEQAQEQVTLAQDLHSSGKEQAQAQVTLAQDLHSSGKEQAQEQVTPDKGLNLSRKDEAQVTLAQDLHSSGKEQAQEQNQYRESIAECQDINNSSLLKIQSFLNEEEINNIQYETLGNIDINIQYFYDPIRLKGVNTFYALVKQFEKDKYNKYLGKIRCNAVKDIINSKYKPHHNFYMLKSMINKYDIFLKNLTEKSNISKNEFKNHIPNNLKFIYKEKNNKYKLKDRISKENYDKLKKYKHIQDKYWNNVSSLSNLKYRLRMNRSPKGLKKILKKVYQKPISLLYSLTQLRFR
jgi:hypothetical protein